ncbi:glycine-rich domain-containing protein [Acidomonas methanolica]|uniref:glycine-rich domain-containing protein n=1 Tax=Acidomonas methanolica TaxID=437 RepID=UPI00211A42E0|nr:hypothetical protein [Acidomonas methanolica]MCQ9154064.1 hypothetical protein [Acidomonas methanolica]
MDRTIVYAGSIPLDTDVLRAGRYVKEGVGRLAEMLFGQGAMAASGLACTPSTTALSVTIGPGSILAPGALDATAIGGAGGGLAADTTAIACQYLNEAAQVVAIPSSGVTCTIYALCSEVDTDGTVLPFYNAADPAQTLAGVSNDGAALPTRRTGTMSFVAATSAPAAPAGGAVVALHTLTVPSEATTLAGVTPEAGQVFWPTIPELATLTLLRAATSPMALMAQSGMIGIPAWASRVELRVIGGGGGGSASNSQSTSGSFSGSGGGAGGDAWGVYAVNPSGTDGLQVTVGAGGAQQMTGGTTLVVYQGQTLLQAAGGVPGTFYATQGSAGGIGGAASGGTIWNLTGGYGGDGQCGTATFAGYGGDGPWGGGGRCGADAGMPGMKFGAGGGGAYSIAGSTSAGGVSTGGAGYQGCVLYRFLP